MTKKQAQQIHAKRRALERYELKLNRFDMKEIRRIIHAGKAFKINDETNRIRSYYLEYKEKWIKIIFDRSRQTVVTFLPISNNEIELLNTHYKHAVAR